MDGTFLDPQARYDRERFERVRARMRERGVRLVIASGNQYEQLHSFFDDPDELAYVAENGAYVLDGTEVLFVARPASDTVARVLHTLDAVPGLQFLASGPEGAFVTEDMGRDYADLVGFYYPRIARLPSWSDLDAPIFKFCIEKPDGIDPAFAADLTDRLDGLMTPVTSGHSSIDIIVPGCHKANGLQRLLDRWQVDAADCAAFGDSGNDLEMLRLVGHGVAMTNASDEVKQAARLQTASNADAGVLRQLEAWYS